MSVSIIITSIQYIMRKDAGVDGDAQRIWQVAWFLFLKVFDSQEEELDLIQDDYEFPIPEDYLLRNWTADKEGITGEAMLDFINNKLFPDLKNLHAIPKTNPRGFVVKEAFGDAFNYMKNGTLLRQEAFDACKKWWGGTKKNPNSRKGRKESEVAWKVTIQDNISVTKSRSIVFPMPPLAEQYRIVEKVDKLMALCGEIKTNHQ